jgi:CRISPR-associated endoribonuclease Cas6
MPVIAELKLHSDQKSVATTRQLHGAACALFEGATYAGHNSQEKPFAVWPLQPVRDGWLLRASWLPEGIPQTLLAGCGQLRLGQRTYAVTDFAVHPATHAALAAGPVAGGADLRFHSATYFSHMGDTLVVPQPSLMLGSWCRRWNTSVDDERLLISDELLDEIGRAVRLTEFDLRTEARDRGYEHRDRTGFAGTAKLRLAAGCSEEIMRAFTALAGFAEFSGTGAQTTHGFGATTVTFASRPVPSGTVPPGRAAVSRARDGEIPEDARG